MAARAGQVAVGCPPTPHRPPQVQPLHPTEGDPQRGARVPTPGSLGTSAGKGRHWGHPPCHSPGCLPRPGPRNPCPWDRGDGNEAGVGPLPGPLQRSGSSQVASRTQACLLTVPDGSGP